MGGAGATVEITTMDPHNLQVGERIMLMGFTPAAYNGEFPVIGGARRHALPGHPGDGSGRPGHDVWA